MGDMKKILLIVSGTLLLGGCSSLISKATTGFTNNLTAAVLNQDDPAIVRDGVPTLLLTLDSLIEGSPESADLLASGAKLYASYGALFVDDPARASRLTTRARGYAARAMCESYAPSCGWPDATYDDFMVSLPAIGSKDADYLFAYGFASLAYLRAHSSDWNSLAELPQIEALLDHYLDISGDGVDSSVYTFMGVLLTLRPPALGGEPERAREFFERAIADSGGHDLNAKVEFAKGYAKTLYERELHDRLLNEVVNADPYQDGFVLSNVMAQEEAAILLAEADDYF